MAAIGYEWGSVQHPRGRDKCPDNLAHSMIAQSFVTFSGGFKGQKPYSAAPINSIVYPVEGGMEDWAYAAGWDTELNSKCDGRSSQAVPPPNRAVTFLVETSDKKSPPASEMGHDIGILDYDTSQQYGGHVSRNTRLSLVGIDTVQPYVCFAKVASSPSPHTLSVSWYVGGGFEVKSTWISWHIPPSHLMSRLLTISDSSEFSEILEQFVHSVSPPSPPILGHEKWIPQNKAARFHASGWFSGPARWKWKNPFDYNEGLFEVHEVHLPFNISQFHKRDRRSAKSRRYSLELNTSHHQSSPRSLSEIDNHEITLLLVAWAEVDSDWGTPGQGYPATLSDPKHIRARRLRAQFPPQSHLSHARSNPDWKVVNALGETKILGRRYFPSDPVVVKVAAKEGQHRMSHFMTNVEIQSSVHHCASWSRRKGSREGEDH